VQPRAAVRAFRLTLARGPSGELPCQHLPWQGAEDAAGVSHAWEEIEGASWCGQLIVAVCGDQLVAERPLLPGIAG
jgi:hypothetical protein